MAGEDDDFLAPEFDLPEGDVGVLGGEEVPPIPDAGLLATAIAQDFDLGLQAEQDPDEALFQAFEGLNPDDGLDEDDIVFAALEGREPVPAAPRQPLYRAPAVAIGPQAIAGPDGGIGEAVGQAPQNVVWRPLYDLPGYMGNGAAGNRAAMDAGIRMLGRTIFRSMPCFRRMEEECRAAGRDPLGEVQVLADIGGRGPNAPQEMRAMAAWIRGNGRLIDGMQVEFPMLIPGYRPVILLAASEDDSFLMVEESRATGAPHEAVFIYSWRGGRQVYDLNQAANGALQRLDGPMRAVAGAGGQQPALIGPVAAATPVEEVARLVEAAPEPVVVPLENENAPAVQAARTRKKPVADEQKIEALPQVALPPRAGEARPALPGRLNAMQVFRLAGFGPVGTPGGPALQKATDDGRMIRIHGAGKSIALATSFRVSLLATPDSEQPDESCILDGYQEVLDWADSVNTRHLAP